jgi:hypothetical protein
MYTKSILATAALAALASAKTDLAGCTSSQTVAFGGASMIYWVPGTGEICSFLDCGGGRAPPKYNVPGCPAYTGTAAYTPDYLPGYGEATPTPSAVYTASSAAATSETAVYVAPTPSSEGAGYGYGAYPSGTSTLETVTKIVTTPAPVYPTGSSSAPVVGSTGVVVPSANGTAPYSTASPSAPLPEFTGAANKLAQGAMGLVGVVAGLAML